MPECLCECGHVADEHVLAGNCTVTDEHGRCMCVDYAPDEDNVIDPVFDTP